MQVPKISQKRRVRKTKKPRHPRDPQILTNRQKSTKFTEMIINKKMTISLPKKTIKKLRKIMMKESEMTILRLVPKRRSH